MLNRDRCLWVQILPMYTWHVTEIQIDVLSQRRFMEHNIRNEAFFTSFLSAVVRCCISKVQRRAPPHQNCLWVVC
ncbi:hypothetical protein GOP47_0001955 [Adiantum capillus-veneris]|uniref:Uncharacterized protein n=1 Tax=Adiantum capillus-veneris TaxID=13818 RepID=A0A9D4VB38_ADICA|nr:hypothetical protein GOP47_0001955 [Adiantum capillus-veneris]